MAYNCLISGKVLNYGLRWRYCLWICLIFGGTGIFGLQPLKCSHICMCTMDEKSRNLRVDCTKTNLTTIPSDLNKNAIVLDLSLNQLSNLPERAFSKLTHLEVLSMVSNSISSLSHNVFIGLNNLIQLYLQGNRLQTVPVEALRELPSLELLHLDNNNITTVPDDSFKSLKRLLNVRLDVNLLKEIPVTALNKARTLNAIFLSSNQIKEVPDYAFVNLTNLAVLILSNNRISHISENAFYGLPVLKLLDLSNNRLTEIPAAINALPDLFELSVRENRIQYLPDRCFASNKKLSLLNLKENPIASCGVNTFSGLPGLGELVISEAHELTVFPNLAGSTGLQKISLDRASITSLPDQLCQNLHSLAVLDVHTNKISSIPNMSDCKVLTSLNLGNNGVMEIVGSPFEGLQSLKDLILSYNKIRYISDLAFLGLHKLQYLDLSNNLISYIHPDAFAPLKSLEDLNVGENQFESLPTKGLQKLRNLKTFHNTRLQEPLPFDAFPHILTLKVAYAYHCCAFINHYKSDKNIEGALTFDEKVEWLVDVNATPFLHDRSNFSYDWDEMEYYYDINTPLYEYDLNRTFNYTNESGSHDYDKIASIYTFENIVKIKPPVRCEPLPDPFQPCDDLFGWWSLRCGVWIVFLLAVLGNGTVLFVSLTSKSKMDVTRFLICNLAMSDLCMGIYLGFLAVVDASTLGNFENHAIYWQTGPGCLVAGFLGVLSSELSVFTLVVITVERFYAISHAMQIGKRVRLGHAGIVMACGWIVCLSIASLPLFKVSDYRKFAICLPFDTEDELSLAYVCFIMIFNAISFIVIVICYGGMFISIRASHTWNSKDSIVAKRMALLVFTDFFCWAPIIFFSLTAAFNWHFARISLDEAKVLTIFVLPLNSCANPFLYAFFTRQFKRDCVKLCKRIEESSISRHFSSSGHGRMSAVSHRHHQNISCSGKRSCDNSLNEPSTSGEASSSNNPSDDSDLTVRKLPLTREEKQILHYMRSDFRPQSRLASPTELSSPEIDNRPILRRGRDKNESRAARLSPRQVITEEGPDSSHDIVLHTKEGNVYLSAKPKNFKGVRHKEGKVRYHRTDKCAQRLCHYSVKSIKRTQSIPLGSRSVHSQTADSFGENENVRETMETEIKDINVEDKARKKFETDRSKDLGLKIDSFKPKSVQAPTNAEPDKTIRKTISTQTEMLVQLRHTRNPELSADITKREKDKHINEWRKTSHLSFLWRNSGNFDVLNQKQKSNSLVELTRPLNNLQNVASKRHSLTSKHEGYILLKNSSRDSAYEEDELYEFYDSSIKCPDVEKQNCKSSEKTSKNEKDKKEIIKENKRCSPKTEFSIDSDECCETSMLLSDRLPDNLCIPKGRQSCDIESGISSSS